METLQRAFQNIYDTMDQIDQFKLQALQNMKQTVDTLGTEVEKSKGYIARAEGVKWRFHPFGAGDIALRLLDLAAERVDRLLHVAERLELEAVDRVHRVVDVLEGALQRLERDRRGRGLLVDLAGLGLSISPVDSIMLAVVVLSAVICSSTSFWLVIAWATVTAVRSAETVVVEARSTPFTSSTLFFLTRSSAR